MASILSNASVASSGRVINAAIGIAVTILLTRLLNPTGYGAYSAILSYGMLFQIAGDLGLYLTLTRLLGKSSEHRVDIATTVSLRIALLGVLFFAGLIVARLFSPFPGLNIALLIIMIGLLLQSLSQLCIGVYQAASTIWPATVGDLVGRLIQVGAVAWVFWAGVTSQGVLMASIAFTAGAAVACGIHIYLLPHRRFFWPVFSWKRWQELIKISWPLGLLLVLNTIYFRVDMVMLPLWRGAAEVGLYALAYRIIENLLFFPAMFGGLLLPHFSRLVHQPTAQAQTILGEALKVMLVGAAGVTLLLLSAPDVVIGYIGGHQFLDAIPLLKILTLALLCMCFGNVFGFVLVAQGKNKTLLALYAFLVVFNVVGNIIFIPRFGATAAAWTTVVTEVIAASTAGYIVLKHIRASISPHWLWRWGVATAISVVVALRIPPAMPGLARVVVLTLLFTATQALLGSVRKSEFTHLLEKPRSTYANN